MRTMTKKRAELFGGKLSYPAKMDCPSWGIPATRCRVGSLLASQEGTTCSGCYALKGTFRFKSVQKALEENYQKLFDPLWTPAMAAIFRWEAEDRARLFVSGDVQGVNHLLNIIALARAVPETVFWMPTREIATLIEVERKLIDECLEWPENLIARVSSPMVNGKPLNHRYTSTVVTESDEETCPTSVEGGNCQKHGCTRCWYEEGNVAYLKH